LSYVDVHSAVKEASPKGGEMLMTIAEKLRNEGKEEGKEKVALQMLFENEPVEKITRYTGLTKDRIEELRRQS